LGTGLPGRFVFHNAFHFGGNAGADKHQIGGSPRLVYE
jgi:hypothetical protein